MQKITFCTTGTSPALTFARHQLAAWGYTVLPKVTDQVTHLLLPVPILETGSAFWEQLLASLSNSATILGGNLPALPVPTVDFLKDPYYTAENAAITAHCALNLAMQAMPRTLQNTKVLVIGWGRIGKCLTNYLHALGAEVTVAARDPSDRALLEAMGYAAIGTETIPATLFDLILNTVPAPIMDSRQAKPGTILLDLASTPGITGDSVIYARGLPGKMAPESAGILMAKTALRYALGKE